MGENLMNCANIWPHTHTFGTAAHSLWAPIAQCTVQCSVLCAPLLQLKRAHETAHCQFGDALFAPQLDSFAAGTVLSFICGPQKLPKALAKGLKVPPAWPKNGKANWPHSCAQSQAGKWPPNELADAHLLAVSGAPIALSAP